MKNYFNTMFIDLQLLKELDLNIDVDVAFLAGQTPPIKIFPTPNSSQLPYNEQLAMLESDYIKHYSYRGDLKYNEKMARSIGNKTGKSGTDEETCMYRVCRDRNRFFETRIKDDVLILGKILESMIERTTEMEKHLEKVLLESGETSLPNWDEIFEEATASGSSSEKNYETKAPAKSAKCAGNAKRQKERKINSVEQNSIGAMEQSHDYGQQMLTHEQAQMLVAQMMLARSLAHSNRIHVNPEYMNSTIRMTTESNQSPTEQ